MSCTRRVPGSLPSLTHSSLPAASSSALKKSRSPTAVSDSGRAAGARRRCRAPGACPSALPSLAHSSSPCSPSTAAKKSVPPASVRKAGNDPSGPATMSAHQVRARLAAVADPQLGAVLAVVGAEVEQAVAGRQRARKRALRRRARCRAPARVPAAGPVAGPQLDAVVAVVGGEEHRVADRDQVGRRRSDQPLVDVAHPRRARRRAVAAPQLAAADHRRRR